MKGPIKAQNILLPRISGLDVPQDVKEHGSEIRRYLQRHITPVLLDGMKQAMEAVKFLAATEDKPEDPVKWMGEWLLLARSAEFGAEGETAADADDDGVRRKTKSEKTTKTDSRKTTKNRPSTTPLLST